MARVAVILAGCGYLDGAEIRESVLLLLYLDQLNCDVECFAADVSQHHVIDHLTKTETKESRNVLHESARIARSALRPLSELNEKEFDALVLPGGFGVAKNMSSLAFKGSEAEVLPEYAKAIQAFYAVKKPIGAICIAPAVVALALKNQGISLTIGDDAATASVITATGNVHVEAVTNMAVVDTHHAVASCSAYMRDDRLTHVAEGIEKCVRAVVSMCESSGKRKAS